MAAMSTLVSTFDGGIDAAWDKTQGDSPSNVTAVANGVQIAHTTASGYNDIRAVTTYSLTGSAGYVQVTDYGDQSLAPHECIFMMTDNTFNNNVQFLASGNSLFAYKTISGSTTAVGSSITLDTTAHRWLRLREASGTTFWDTSPDGATWTNRWSVANPITVTALIPLIRCGVYTTVASGSQMKFDNFNTVGGAAGAFFNFFSVAPPRFATGGGGGGAAANRPVNPAIFVYNSTSGDASAWAHPGALVIAGRENYDDAKFHTMAAGGATVLIYLHAFMNNTVGRYADLLYNSSAYGGAVPQWPGNPGGDEYGDLVDMRVGSTLLAKLPGVMNLMVSENPHISGFFMDGLGTLGAWPDFNWNAWSNSDKEAYRNGIIAIAQIARDIADANDLFVMHNGTWQGTGATLSGSGGYPDRTQHGCSLADGALVENHDPLVDGIPFWYNYAHASQWGAASETTSGIPYIFFQNTGDTSSRDTWIANDCSAFAATNAYDAGIVTPWTTITDFGLPNKA